MRPVGQRSSALAGWRRWRATRGKGRFKGPLYNNNNQETGPEDQTRPSQYADEGRPKEELRWSWRDEGYLSRGLDEGGRSWWGAKTCNANQLSQQTPRPSRAGSSLAPSTFQNQGARVECLRLALHTLRSRFSDAAHWYSIALRNNNTAHQTCERRLTQLW